MAGLPNISRSVEVPKQNEEQLKQWFIGSIDQGTTSTRFLIFDGTGTPIASHQMEFKQIYLHSGLVHLRVSSSKTRAGIDVDADG
jgi:hypothetical protein